jgi:agmatinase
MKTKNTYAGIPKSHAEYEHSKVVLIPVPFDQTSTWQKGADKGPSAFLEASDDMELYDIETESEAYKHGIYLNDSQLDLSSPETMVDSVYKITKKNLNQNKLVTLIGGEHSISIGAIRAFYENFDDLSILHIDAHADLRPQYDGSRYNHACALYEANQNTNLVQVGIRSMDISEMDEMNTDNVFFAQDMVNDDYWMENAVNLLTDKVYITFDLDALDPSIMPSTGTPEPGGLLWYETLEFLRMVFKEKEVVGFDIVELCPNENDKSSDFTAAKLYYKMLSYKFVDEEPRDYESDDEDDFDQDDKYNSFKYKEHEDY